MTLFKFEFVNCTSNFTMGFTNPNSCTALASKGNMGRGEQGFLCLNDSNGGSSNMQMCFEYLIVINTNV